MTIDHNIGDVLYVAVKVSGINIDEKKNVLYTVEAQLPGVQKTPRHQDYTVALLASPSDLYKK